MKHAAEYFEKLGAKPEIIELHHLVPKEELPDNMECEPAFILVVKDGVKLLLGKDKSIKDLHK